MIIFTDLDGTLLDHESYKFEPAREALQAIKARGVPLIFATSKTAAEIAPLREATSIVFPAIVENGAGIDWPDNHSTSRVSGALVAYDRIRQALADLPNDLRSCFRGFGDMSDEELAERTALPIDAARLARRRGHSEPGILSGDEEQRAAFDRHLADAGLSAVQGGRFLTVSGGATKADRLAEIESWWSERQGHAAGPSLALGDAENDIAMLEAADFGVIVRNDAHPPLPALAGEAEGRIWRSKAQGPAGFNEAVLAFLAERGAAGEGTAR